MTTITRDEVLRTSTLSPAFEAGVLALLLERDALKAQLAETSARGLREFEAHQETIGQCDRLRAALEAAAKSLEAVTRIDPQEDDWRAYARNRAKVARAALAGGEKP